MSVRLTRLCGTGSSLTMPAHVILRNLRTASNAGRHAVGSGTTYWLPILEHLLHARFDT